MRQPSVTTKLTLEDPIAIPIIEFDLTLANKIPSLITAISNVIVYIYNVLISEEYLTNNDKCWVRTLTDLDPNLQCDLFVNL